MQVLRVENLWKIYPGGVEALRGVSLELEEGVVAALVGPNGAGKTTMFRIIAGLLKPTRGRVVVDGVEVHRNLMEARRRFAYLPEEVGGYRNLTGREYIRLVVTLYLSARGATRREIEEAVEEAERLSGLGDALSKRMREYSKGMKRRVQVAWILAVAPRLAILDEPTSGLDVEASYRLRMLIREKVREKGVTVLFSSHNMLEVEHMADVVFLIHRGRIIAEGHPREIIEKTGARNLEEAYMTIVGGLG